MGERTTKRGRGREKKFHKMSRKPSAADEENTSKEDYDVGREQVTKDSGTANTGWGGGGELEGVKGN